MYLSCKKWKIQKTTACQVVHICPRELLVHTLSKVTTLSSCSKIHFSPPTHRKSSWRKIHTSATRLQELVMQRKYSIWWSHLDLNSHWRPRFLWQWLLDPQESAIWLTFTPQSLVQYYKRDYSQEGNKFLTAWSLPSFCWTFQSLFSSLHFIPRIPNECLTLCS